MNLVRGQENDMTADFWSSHIDDLLPGYHNGTLGAEDRLRVDTHLKRCATCQSASADWSAIANAIGESQELRTQPKIEAQSASLPFWMKDLEAGRERQRMQQSFSANAIPLAGERKRWTKFSTMAPVLLLVIILTIAVAATQILQSGNQPTPTLPAMAALGSATAESATSVDCTLEASSLDRLNVSGETVYPDALQADQRSSEEAFAILQNLLPTGQLASQEQVDGVQSSLDQLVACMNAGSKEQTLSVFTDDYLRRLRNHNFSLELGSLSAFAPTYGSNANDSVAPYQLQSVVILPDGRLGALATGPTGDDTFGPPEGVYFVFVNQGDRWLIDEAAPIKVSNELNTPEIETYEAELGVSDDGFTPTTLDVPPGRIVVTVTNSGTKPHSVVIPEHYIRVEVAPGKSKQFQITRNAETPFRGEGVIGFRSDLPGDTSDAFSGQIVVGSGVAATPAEGETNPYANTLTLLPTASTTIAFPIAANTFEPAIVPILADRDVAVTLINPNSGGSARFIIKELGIDIELAPGETRMISINAPAGVYAFYSPQGDDLRNGAFGTLVVLADDRPMDGGIDNS
jgi:anti-sigma factor RsiW